MRKITNFKETKTLRIRVSQKTVSNNSKIKAISIYDLLNELNNLNTKNYKSILKKWTIYTYFCKITSKRNLTFFQFTLRK